jgi:hypothetical protein
MIEHADFSVTIKDNGPSPKPWRWEINRVGRTSAVQSSTTFFDSGKADRAGKQALSILRSEHPAD